MVESDASGLGDELERQSAWMRRLVRRLVHDADEVDDVVQETRVAAWRHEREGLPVERGWLAQVARNFALRRRRDESRRREHERAGSRAEALPPTDDLAARLDAQHALAEELNALPEPFRSALARRYFDGWTAARIARDCGVPPSTARTRIERGLELLRERLDRRHGGRGAWLSALAPLAAPPMPIDALPVPASTFVPGALAMKIGLHVVAAMSVVALVGAGLVWRGSTPEAVEDVAAASARATDAFAPRPHTVDAPADESARGAVVAPVVAPAEVVAAPAPEPTRVEARVVDALARPLAGARAYVAGDARSVVESDREGRVALTFDDLVDARPVALGFEAPGFAVQFVDVRVDPGRTTRLGDVALSRGGAVAGRVVDVEGRPLAGARVLATAPGLWEPDPEHARRCGPSDLVRAASTTSGADGTFLLDGLAAGGARVWAAVRDMRYGVSPPLVVRADETLADVVLTVEPLQREDEIAGVVLAPDGEPAGPVGLRVRVRSGGNSYSWTESAGADGRFRFRVRTKAPHELVATDADARWPQVGAADVAPGSSDVVLRFATPRSIAARAATVDGRTIASFALRAIAADGGEVLERSDASTCTDGRCAIRVPGRAFLIECRAAGHAAVTLGPFDPRSAPDALDFRLEARAGVTGRVLARGAPHAGAHVTLWRAISPKEYVEVGGYPALRRPQAVDEVVTGADGRFFLLPDEPGEHVVRADDAGYAPSETGPLDLDPGRASGDVELALGNGGRIEGVVLVPHGRSDEGVLVVANRGDGRPRTTRSGAGGTFAFERLAAGPWDVSRGRIELMEDVPSDWSHSTAATPTVLDADCDVVEGGTTRFVLDLRDDGPAIVAGRLVVDGAPAAHWTMRAWPGDKSTYTGELPSTALDARGEFELALAEPGPARLVFSRPDPSGAQGRIEASTVLARGRNAWSGDFATARVTGRSMRPSADTYVLSVSIEGDGARSSVPIRTDAEGRFELPAVLAGRATFRGAQIVDGRHGESRVLLETTLARGATAQVDLH